MNVSISQLMSVLPVMRALSEAVATAIGDSATDPNYQLSQADAEKIAALIDERYQRILMPGQADIFGSIQTTDDYSATCKDIADSIDVAIKIFRFAGLDTPDRWVD